MLYLFLDTNIYIHYKDIEQIDWHDLFDLSKDEPVSIIIPPIIIKEIDNLKDRDSNPKRKKKAKSISAKISDYLLSDKKGKINISSCKEPMDSDFEANQLDKDSNDNIFILSAKLFKEEYSADIKIVSADNINLYKAKQLGLPYYRIEDSLRLKEELSREEKENEELKKKLQKYEQRQSKPQIQFHDGNEILRLKRPMLDDFNEKFKICVEKEISQYEHWSIEKLKTLKESAKSREKSFDFILAYAGISENTILEYNKEIDEYLDEYKLQLKNKLLYEELSSSFYKMKFIIANLGTSPTGDLNIFLEFPSDITLYSSDNLVEYYIEPLIKPRDSITSPFSREHMKMIASLDNNRYSNFHRQHLGEKKQRWDLTHRAKYRYKLHAHKLIHGLYTNLEIDDLYLDLRTSPNFSINYSIHDESLMEPVKGKLNVVVE